MKKLILTLVLITNAIAISQNEKTHREPFTLDIVVNGKQNYSMEVQKTPYFVKEKILQIYPSEKLFIEAEVKGDTIHSMKVVEKNINPEKTIEIEFSQNAEDRDNVMMMLNVKNPFDRKLNYSALMYTPMSNNWKKTSIIPIRPKLQNFESWPHAIITLVLENWRFESN